MILTTACPTHTTVTFLQPRLFSMRLFACLAALLVVPHLQAEPIQFARTPDLSPDGKTVAFSYLGDVWLAPSEGGPARLLTMHEKHDSNPIFSPDGKHLAFSS